MKIASVLATSLIVLGVGIASAAVPPAFLNYQGVLRDASDNPLDGTYDMVFRFYAPSDVLLVTDRHLVSGSGGVVVVGGMFDVVLGSGTIVPGASAGLSQAFRDHQEVYLEVQIGADGVPGTEILAPRTRILASPYALNADHLDGLSSAAFSLTGHTHAGSEIVGTVDDSDHLDGFDSTAFAPTAHTHPGSAITSAVAEASAADTLDGLHASAFGRLASTNTWTSPNTFKRYPAGSGFADGSVAVNPDSASANATLFGVGVGIAEKFRVDAEGDAVASGSLNVSGGSPAVRLQTGAGTTLAQMFSNDTSNYTYLYDYQNARYALYSGTSGLGIGTNSLDATFSVTVPSLRVRTGGLGLAGYMYMSGDGPDGTQSIYFYDDGARAGEYFRWDDVKSMFVTSASFGTADRLYVNHDGPDGDQFLYFYEDGGPFEALYWVNTSDQFYLSDALTVEGDLSALGAKPFIQNHPYDPDLSVVYAALEGDEVGTYTRGTARLIDGEAHVPLGDTFSLVTDPEIGLTAQVTPRDDWADLYVASVSTTDLVVRARAGALDGRFDYVVQGLRIGFEDFRTVRPRDVEAPVPSTSHYAREAAERPDLVRFTARHRFRPSESSVFDDEAGAATELRRAIGEYDPDVDDPNRESRRVRETDAETNRSAPASAPTATQEAAARSAGPDQRSTPGPGAVADDAAPPVRTSHPFLPVSETVEAGDVLALDPERPGLLRRAVDPADPSVVGVVAGESTVIGNDAVAPVAGFGFVEVRVDAGYGPIRPGDLLTTSATPGHAMLAYEARPGTIVGKALDGMDAGTGVIRALLTPR